MVPEGRSPNALITMAASLEPHAWLHSERTASESDSDAEAGAP